jgi:Leucine-rich repeat (LRR) protein
MQTVTLKLINAAGSPVAYPGAATVVAVPTIADVTKVWVGVSLDGLTNQAYPITTPLATIKLSYPRIYQGISADVLGDTNVYLNSLEEYQRRLAACCLQVSSGDSSSGASSPGDSGEVPDGFQMRFFLDVDGGDLSTDVGITFGVTGSMLTGFIDWGEGAGEEEFFNSDNDMEAHHTYSTPGSYEVRIRFSEPLDGVLSMNQLWDQTALPMTGIEFNEVFPNFTALDLNSNAISELDVTNLPALDSLAMGGGNHLSSAAVDQILVDLDASGVTGGFADLSSQVPSAPPGATGLAAKASLQGKGWTVAND